MKVKNTSPDSVEFNYEISRSAYKLSDKRKRSITEELYKLENIEYVNVVALGVDIWAGEIVLSLRDARQTVRLICASPMMALKEAGVTCGRNDTQRSSMLPIRCVTFAPVIADPAFRFATNGWSIILPG